MGTAIGIAIGVVIGVGFLAAIVFMWLLAQEFNGH